MQYDETAMIELCREWQAALGLSHWRIDVKIVRGVEIRDKCGQVDISFVEEQALVRIKSPEDYHGYFPYDMEQTLVHELLHIVFDIAGNDDSVLYEQALDRIARLVIALKRKT